MTDELFACHQLCMYFLHIEWAARSANFKTGSKKVLPQTVRPPSPLPVPHTFDTGDLWIFS